MQCNFKTYLFTSRKHILLTNRNTEDIRKLLNCNFKYKYETCNKIGYVRMNNGQCFVHSAEVEANFKLNSAYTMRKTCIEEKDRCENDLCSRCFHFKYISISNHVLITNHFTMQPFQSVLHD